MLKMATKMLTALFVFVLRFSILVKGLDMKDVSEIETLIKAEINETEQSITTALARLKNLTSSVVEKLKGMDLNNHTKEVIGSLQTTLVNSLLDYMEEFTNTSQSMIAITKNMTNNLHNSSNDTVAVSSSVSSSLSTRSLTVSSPSPTAILSSTVDSPSLSSFMTDNGLLIAIIVALVLFLLLCVAYNRRETVC